jgi:hypothetical protein
MPRKTRRQLVGKQEDIERQEREDELRALERELHQEQQENENFLPQVIKPAEMVIPLFQAKIRLLTLPA